MFTFFTTGQFWFLMGILFVVVAMGAKAWFDGLGYKMNWWKWMLAGIWWFLLFFTVYAVFTFLGEGEPRAFWLGLLIFGVIDIILGVGLWRLLAGNRQGKPAAEA